MKKFDRIKRLNDLLKHHQGYTMLDLMALLDAGERTVRKDLCQIQQAPYHAELWNEYRGKERLYRYKDVSYSLPLFDDNDHVRDKLQEAMKAIAPYKNTPQYEWLRMCLAAVENESLMGVSSIMSFDNNAYLMGIEHLKEEGYKWILKDAYLFDEPITGVKGKLHLFDYDIDENNLPSAHKVQLNTLKLDGDELVFPVNSELWNKISQMQGGGEYDSVVLNIDDSIVDMICRPGMYNLKPIQSIRFIYGDEMQRFEVSPVSYSYFDADANGVLYDYYSLQTKDIARLPLAGYYLDRRLAEGEAATVKEWQEPK